MNAGVLGVGILLLAATMPLGAGTGTAQATVAGSLHGDQPVKASPSYKAPDTLRGRNGERVEITCFTYDAESTGLEWRQITIRGTRGWAVGAVRDDPVQKIPPCGPDKEARS